MAENNPNDQGSIKELRESFEQLGRPLDKILDAIGSMYEEAEKLNNAFLQGRSRLDEMDDAVSRAAAGVIRLGGSISEVSATMASIAEGSRRNVIATEEQVSELYAAARILETNAGSLVEKFAEAGYETSQIGTNLADSINYVQSVGLNAKDVMGDVTQNMSLMNKFNFSDGVQGLTKMAAQASMLRFDMSATKDFAEKVMDPEEAIKTAAGLQRLGVAFGQLGDPFAMMNDSLTNPGALQDSLIKATKQFVELDAKTGAFKINPQGLLTLREMAKETGISYDQLTKSALAAADFDKRISAISPSLQFEKEEDKQFLANMATMKGGEYVVQLKDDETGIIQQKKLSEITSDELRALREQQENAPKTIEEIQLSQLNEVQRMRASLDANIAKGTFGIAGSEFIRGNIRGAGRITRAVAGSVDRNVPESSKITESVNDAVKKMGELFTLKDIGKISDKDFAVKLTSLENEIKNKANTLGEKGFDALKNILRDTDKQITGKSGIELAFKKYTSELLGTTNADLKKSSSTSKITGTKKIEPISKSSIFGTKSFDGTSEKTSSVQTVNSKIDFGGVITIKVDAPPGVSQQQLKTYFESEEFKRLIYEYQSQKSKELERRK
jgi:hypothetical protein